MTGKKWLLAVAAAAFVGWIAYLGYAVFVHRFNPPDLVSRSQLVEAECVLVVEVTLADGKPNPTAEVTRRLSDVGPEAGPVRVVNLPDATTPTNTPLAAGQYLLFLTADGIADPRTGPYRIAGWPRGLGEGPATQPGDTYPIDAEKEQQRKALAPFAGSVVHLPDTKFVKVIRPPLAHPWSDSVQKQMKGLGYKW